MRPAELEAASIVMVGSFNPAIFQPRWLGTQTLIRPEEAAEAKISVIQSEVADFSTEWFQLQVLQNRFQLVSVDPRQYGPLRDLAAGICALLPHTPVKTVGLSRHFHFKMETTEIWHGIGHRLAPKEIWNPILTKPGLRSMTMEAPIEGTPGAITVVKVEPSAKIHPGLFIEVTQQFPGVQEPVMEALWVAELLSGHWDPLVSYAERVADHLLTAARTQ